MDSVEPERGVLTPRVQKNIGDPAQANLKNRSVSPTLQLDYIQISADVVKSEYQALSGKKQLKNEPDVPEGHRDGQSSSSHNANRSAKYEPMTAAEAQAALRGLGNRQVKENIEPAPTNLKKRGASPILRLDYIQISSNVVKSEYRAFSPKRQRKNSPDVSGDLDGSPPDEVESQAAVNKYEPMTADEAQAALRRLGNPKAEIKEEAFLDDDAIMRRLEPAGLHPFPVTLAPGIRDRTVSRPALSQHFGGNLRSSFPAIPAGKLAEHGYDNFMCINLLYAPHAPQNPGHPGLFLQLTPARGSWAQQRPDCHWDTMVVFVRLKAGAWLYLGEYEMTPVASLTPGEWRAQSDAVRRNWSENTAAKGWARYIRAKIHLRRRLGRDPTEEEIDAGMEDKQQYDDVTAEDVVEAYDTGAEAMGAWCMKCVGYDEDFQRLVGSLEQSKRPLKTTRKTARKGTRT